MFELKAKYNERSGKWWIYLFCRWQMKLFRKMSFKIISERGILLFISAPTPNQTPEHSILDLSKNIVTTPHNQITQNKSPDLYSVSLYLSTSIQQAQTSIPSLKPTTIPPPPPHPPTIPPPPPPVINKQKQSENWSSLLAAASARWVRSSRLFVLLSVEASASSGLCGRGWFVLGQLLGEREEQLIDVHRRLRRGLQKEQAVLIRVRLRLLQAQTHTCI